MLYNGISLRGAYIMKNKIFGKVRTKIMIFLIAFSLIPFGIFSFFVYNSYVNEMQSNTIVESVRSLEQADSLSSSEIWRVERVARDLCRNAVIQEKIVNNEQLDENINPIVSEIIDECEEIKGVVIFPYTSTMYDYNIDTGDSDLTDFIIKFGRVTQTNGRLQWLIKGQNIKNYEDAILTGTIVRDTLINKDNSEIATIYFIIDKSIFNSVKNYDGNGIFCVCDREGNIVISSDKNFENNLCTYSMDIYNQVCYNEGSSFVVKDKLGRNMVIKHKSPFTDWYWVKIIDMDIFGREIHNIMWMAVLISFLIVVLLMVAYFFVIRRIFYPLDKIVVAMQQVENHNFDVQLDDKGNDEFSIVAGGFNKMVSEIKNLIEKRVNDEKEKLEAELNALHYQINPHFLYNIIGTMRLSALKEKQYDIAEMMLKLSRLFRNYLNEKSKLVELEDDVNILNDYMALINFRYENKIHFDINIDENTKKCLIPRMLVQPIAENCIMHGVSEFVDSSERQPVVSVETRILEKMLFITVSDNGKGMSFDKINSILNCDDLSRNIGINNVRKRLKLHYGDEFDFSIKSTVGKGTEFIIKLPPVYGNGIEF